MKTFLIFLLVCSTHLTFASFNPGKNVIRTETVPATPDPVEATGGAFYFSKTLLDIGGPMGLSFTLHYNSGMEQWAGDVKAPFWWSHKYTLEEIYWNGTNLFKVGFEKGSEVQFAEENGAWHLAGPNYMDNVANGSSVRCDLHVSSNHVYFINYDTEKVYIFEKIPFGMYRIKTIFDRQTNSLIYTYADEMTPAPDRIEDNWGNHLAFLTDGWLITGVVDAINRQVFLRHENAPENWDFESLVALTDAAGHTTHFTYSVVTNAEGFPYFDNIVAIIEPSGVCTYSQVYAVAVLNGEEKARVMEQHDAYGAAVYFSYDPTSNTVTTTWPGGVTSVFEATREYGALTRMTDDTGRSIDMDHNDRQQITTMTDRDGDTTRYAYEDATYQVVAISNALNYALLCDYVTLTQTFHNPFTNESIEVVFSDIGAVHYQDGTIERYYYNDVGALVSNSMRNGAVQHYAYDARGMLSAVSNELGGAHLYAWTDNGRLAAMWDSDPGIGTNRFSYDAVGRVLTNHHPNGTYSVYAYDTNDRLVSMRDALGYASSFTYDENGNLRTVTDPSGNSTEQTYDALDRISTVTNRLGHVVSYAYNALDRLAAFTDPLGNTTHIHTDMEGGITNVIDSAGHAFLTTFTAEGLIGATQTPLGHQMRYGYDALGYLVAVTNPLGHAWHIGRDAMNRVTSVSDPDGQTLVYQYNAIGLLSSVTNAALGAPRYEYDRLGFLTNIHTVNGGNWSFVRSPRGRLTRTGDPHGYATQYAYMPDDQLASITYPDGSTVQYHYNAVGAVTQKNYSAGLSQNFVYDTLGNVYATEHLMFARDAEEQITNTLSSSHAFSAAYDAAGRLVRLGYDNDAFSVTYAYDARGYLTAVSNTRDHTVIDFIHNVDGLLTHVARPNGIDSSYQWDAAQQLIALQHGSIASLAYTYTPGGRVTQCDYTLPLDPAAYVSNTAQSVFFDAAYRIVDEPYAYDRLGRLTNAPAGTLEWDGASRLTRLGETAFSYNGFGDIIEAIGAGRTNHFYYNYALGSTPPVADDYYYYVYTPAGRLLYLVNKTGAPLTRYYHFDRNGSTLFLTDEAGAVTDAYAYEPYGAIMKHTGTTQQPFTYYGQAGVMRLTQTDIYAMQVRWYDARTARFISREPAWPYLDDPYMLNPYQFAANNPISFGDTSGLKYKDEIAKAERDLWYAELKSDVQSFFTYTVNPVYWLVLAPVEWALFEPLAPVVPIKEPKSHGHAYHKENTRHLYTAKASDRLANLQYAQQEYERKEKQDREKKAYWRAFENKLPALRKLALQRAREAVANMKLRSDKKAVHPWDKMDRHQRLAWGMWVKADGEWMFFPDPDSYNHMGTQQMMVKPGFDPRGKYHDRANILTRVNGTDIGVWVHNVQDYKVGNGPRW